MKQLLSSLAIGATLLMAPNAYSKQIADVDVKEQITAFEQTLVLNGAGVRSKFFMDLYVGSLYLSSPLTDTIQILEANQACIRLNITSSMITSDKMQDAIIDGFESATQGKSQEIAQEINQFMSLFNEEIKEGDQFTFYTSKQFGVKAFKNETQLAQISGETFRRALLNIWLGEDPAQQSLKEEMLGE